MKIMTNLTASVAMLLLLAFGTFGSAVADDDAGIPAERLIAAIQTAVAVHPGLIKEIEIEQEDGRVLVEIEIVTADGKEIEVKVDPARNVVIR